MKVMATPQVLTQEAKFRCPSCKRFTYVDVPVKLTAEYGEESTVINVSHLPMTKCPHCNKYMQIVIGEMHIQYAAKSISVL